MLLSTQFGMLDSTQVVVGGQSHVVPVLPPVDTTSDKKSKLVVFGSVVRDIDVDPLSGGNGAKKTARIYERLGGPAANLAFVPLEHDISVTMVGVQAGTGFLWVDIDHRFSPFSICRLVDVRTFKVGLVTAGFFLELV